MADYLDITLTCNGNTLTFGTGSSGKKREFAITAIEGLEASELEIATTDNAPLDGATVDGKRIKERPVHLEAILRSGTANAANRQRIIKFFNPKHTGTMTVDHSGVERAIDYEIEGWTFTDDANLNAITRLRLSVDLICTDPFLRDIDDFGKTWRI
ncbi:MAG: hypothetical protein LUH04_17895 [Clostridium sp.]|nr:hypothetical protein [Clostridium sp.]